MKLKKALTFKIATVYAILIGILVTVSPVGAKGRTSYSFTLTEHPILVGVKMADGNTIVDVIFTENTWTGTIMGTGSGFARLIIHKDGSFNVRHIETFTGSMGSKSGTIIFSLIGHGMATGIWPVEGSWVILGGTCDFATIHGEGTLEGSAGIAITLTGNIHFDP